MPSIIEEIQRDGLDHKVPVSTLLRKVKLAAAKLGLQNVEGWVDRELKGYTSDDEVPDYRRVSGTPMARGVFNGFQPIQFEDPEHAEKLSVVPIGQSIPGIEGQLQSSPKQSLIFPYPPKLAAALNTSNRGRIVQCGVRFESANLISIIEAVRTLVIEWAIAMENAGVIGSGLSFTLADQDKAKAAGIVVNVGTIHQFNGNLGSPGVSGDVIVSSLSIDKVRDFINQVKSHTELLVREGVDKTELSSKLGELEKVVAANASTSVLAKALEELKGTLMTAAGKVVASGVLALLNQMLGTGVPTP
jgi:hypothetical protein